jgi:hypothetical protein
MDEIYDAIRDRYDYLGLCTGTVAVANGDATVTGTGTRFDLELTAGDDVGLLGVVYEIDSITNATSLELTVGYAGSTAGGLTLYGNGGIMWTADPGAPVAGRFQDLSEYRLAIEALAPFFVSDLAPTPVVMFPRYTFATLATAAFGDTDWREPDTTRRPHVTDLNDMKAALELLINPFAQYVFYGSKTAKRRAATWEDTLTDTAEFIADNKCIYSRFAPDTGELWRAFMRSTMANNKGVPNWLADLTSGKVAYIVTQSKFGDFGYEPLQLNAGPADNSDDADDTFDSGFADLIFESAAAASDSSIDTITAADVFALWQVKGDTVDPDPNFGWAQGLTLSCSVAITAGKTWTPF